MEKRNEIARRRKKRIADFSGVANARKPDSLDEGRRGGGNRGRLREGTERSGSERERGEKK